MIVSTNKCYKLVMQEDGNLVIYQIKDQKALWASNTKSTGAAVARMQPDGNFVLYDWNNQAKWSTGTNGRSGAIITLQDDGNLVIYPNTKEDPAFWSSGSFGSC